MPSNHLILCHPLLLPSIFPSIRVFSSESVLRIRSSKYWSFSSRISPSNDYSELIWLVWSPCSPRHSQDLLQHHRSKAAILWCSAFFMVQLSHPYRSTGKNHCFDLWVFIGKVMSLLFNMLSKFVIACLPRSKHLLISWLQSPSAVISVQFSSVQWLSCVWIFVTP